MFIPIQKILPKSITRLGLTKETRAALVCEIYRKFAAQLVHPDALKHTSPKFLKGKTLTIGVENSAWAQQITNCAFDLLKTINKNLGKEKITKIRTQNVSRIADDTI